MHVICRRFSSVGQAQDAYERLARRLEARGGARSLSAALAVDADSAAAFVTVIGSERADIAREAARLGGCDVDPGALPDGYVQGLIARRRSATAGLPAGAGRRTDHARPGVLHADGTVRPF